MKIAGLQKCSMVDFPGKVCCVVFLSGCNMNCSYCHNSELISGDPNVKNIKLQELMDFLLKRKHLIDAVCITGGEPTIHPGLIDLIKDIKSLGYLVKLDTNGTNPEALQKLINAGLLDYIAMDVKASKKKYGAVCGRPVDLSKIDRSIEIIRQSGVEYEFRTTFVPTLNSDDICEIAGEIKGAKAYYLQQFRNNRKAVAMASGDDGYYSEFRIPHMKEYVYNTADKVRANFDKCGVRGI